jgi:hypothetical protein
VTRANGQPEECLARAQRDISRIQGAWVSPAWRHWRCLRRGSSRQIEAEIADAVQSCKNQEGTPNADAVLSVNDVNGDGGEDWIVDYAKFSCKDGINEMCDDDGCTLRIYLWNGAAAWNLAFDETVKSYKFAKHGGTHSCRWSWRDLPATSQQRNLTPDLSLEQELHRSLAIGRNSER